ncbi:MAG: ATP-binding protein [Cytophagales bacterium]|nr:MAG: ATP-binding protein [Cytophagales bacterium]
MKQENPYSSLRQLEVPPHADAMIETFRAIGYNIQTAVADLIDNAISANAKNIWVSFDWEGQESTISILDDGCGMTDGEIIEAMRPGSKNPNEQRDSKDLGRFGLGLKTASFSQCRKLTTASKKENQVAYWTWDLDYISQVKNWQLINLEPIENQLNKLSLLSSGTLIIWEKLDRVVKNTYEENRKDSDSFYQVAEVVKKHLGMVFHRYLETHKIKIFFNDREILPWDPFLKGFEGLQIIPDIIQNGLVSIKGYVLPHRSKLSEEDYKKAEGSNGWNAQQGFYIYRNERLLVAGDWLGMFRKEDHYKLARIMVDLPNTLDDAWQLDIKKSVAIPPNYLKEQLRSIAANIRNKAVEVFRHKGKVLQRKYSNSQFYPIWQEKIRHGKRFYEINREHPIIKGIIENLGNSQKNINELLRLVEETIPISLITIRESENPEQQGKPFEASNHDDIKKMIGDMYKAQLKNGKSEEQAKGYILSIEPFNLYPQYVETLNN